jgi:hypothetical protein
MLMNMRLIDETMRTGTTSLPIAVVGAIQGLRAIRHSAKAIIVSMIFAYKSVS